MNLNAFMQALTQTLSSGNGPGHGAPEWEGWLVLGTLIIGFGVLLWWLYFSPIESPIKGTDAPGVAGRIGDRGRRVLAALILVGGLLFSFGARWDELWHRLYGGFGNDFLWPPHLMIYGGLALNGVFAGFGLAMVRRSGIEIRTAFRANPLVGLLGLIAAYQVASIPSDALWHQIIGPDISAWSLPHVLLTVTSSAVLVIGVAIAGSTRLRHDRPTGAPNWIDVITLLLLAVSSLAALQFGVTEWEWRDTVAMPFGRPLWVYPVVVLIVGVVEADLVCGALRRTGAATTLALVVLGVQWWWVGVARSFLPPGPDLAAPLLLVPPAVALDAWRALRPREADSIRGRGIGAALYALVFLATALPSLGSRLNYPPLGALDVVIAFGAGVPIAIALGVGASAAMDWLSRLDPVSPLSPEPMRVRVEMVGSGPVPSPSGRGDRILADVSLSASGGTAGRVAFYDATCAFGVT